MLSVIMNIGFITLASLLFAFLKKSNGTKADLCLRMEKIVIYTLLVFAVSSFLNANNSFAQDTAIFADLTKKGGEIFMGMRDIVYVVAGFGIIGVAVGGFFGSLNWKWLGAIIIGLIVIAVTAALIQYVTGEKVANITDTLK